MQGAEQDGAGDEEPGVACTLLNQFIEVGLVNLEILRDFFELLDRFALAARQRTDGLLEAVVYVILDQRSLRLAECLLDRMQLLSDVEA